MASLDTTCSHLLSPAPALWPFTAWFPPAAAFENDALTSALAHASASPTPPAFEHDALTSALAHASASPTPSSSTTTSSASELSSVPYDVPAPAQPTSPAGRPQARQRNGRVSKRKPRASRRPATTYISADPADFRRLVQEITGFGVPAAEHASVTAAPRRPDPLAFVLPTLDTSASFRAPPPPQQQQRWEYKTSGGAATGMAAADDSSVLLMQELEAMMSGPAAVSAFPTLESWGMI